MSYGWQKLVSKRAPAGVSVSVLLATTVPFLHMQVGAAVAVAGTVVSLLAYIGMQEAKSLALEHWRMVARSSVIYIGVQKSSFFGINSTPLVKAQVAVGHLVAVMLRQGVHIAAVTGPSDLTGWQNGSEKRDFGLFFS